MSVRLAALVTVLALMWGALVAQPSVASEPTAGEVVLERYDRLVEVQELRPGLAGRLRGLVVTAIGYGVRGNDTDVVITMRRFTGKVADVRRRDRLSKPQAVALRTFARRTVRLLNA